MKKITLLIVALFAIGSCRRLLQTRRKRRGRDQRQDRLPHCNYKKGDHCAVGFKTETAMVYILEKASDT